MALSRWWEWQARRAIRIDLAMRSTMWPSFPSGRKAKLENRNAAEHGAHDGERRDGKVRLQNRRQFIAHDLRAQHQGQQKNGRAGNRVVHGIGDFVVIAVLPKDAQAVEPAVAVDGAVPIGKIGKSAADLIEEAVADDVPVGRTRRFRRAGAWKSWPAPTPRIRPGHPSGWHRAEWGRISRSMECLTVPGELAH